MLLSEIYNRHVTRQADARVRLEGLRKKVGVETADLTQVVVEHLNGGVARAYINESRLDVVTKDLDVEVRKLAGEADNWLRVMEAFNQSLKSLGDVNHWTACIAYDMAHINKTLETVAHQRGGSLALSESTSSAPPTAESQVPDSNPDTAPVEASQGAASNTAKPDKPLESHSTDS